MSQKQRQFTFNTHGLNVLRDVGYSQGDNPESGLVQPVSTACELKTYQNLTEQTACVACDPNTQTMLASPALVDCIRNNGYIEVDLDLSICRACATRTYTDVVDDTVLKCIDCPTGSDFILRLPRSDIVYVHFRI